ncbi:MAG TPA: hypothetical protein PLI01_16105, partial [Nitrospira sp.]|nr:hypothetical protein [Nitrospira sp.]
SRIFSSASPRPSSETTSGTRSEIGSNYIRQLFQPIVHIARHHIDVSRRLYGYAQQNVANPIWLGGERLHEMSGSFHSHPDMRCSNVAAAK